jgi:hypothetical protein
MRSRTNNSATSIPVRKVRTVAARQHHRHGNEERLALPKLGRDLNPLAANDVEQGAMLVAAGLRHVASTRWGTKRYLQMNRLAEIVAIARLFFSGPMGPEKNNANPSSFKTESTKKSGH